MNQLSERCVYQPVSIQGAEGWRLTDAVTLPEARGLALTNIARPADLCDGGRGAMWTITHIATGKRVFGFPFTDAESGLTLLAAFGAIADWEASETTLAASAGTIGRKMRAVVADWMAGAMDEDETLPEGAL